MKLELESGLIIDSATDADLARIEGEEFAILSVTGNTYMQCAESGGPPWEYMLEYQEGSIEQHYQATDDPITLNRVLAALKKYLHDDASWRDDFQWERLDLS